MALRIVIRFVPSCGRRGNNVVCRLVGSCGGCWPILVCIGVVPWGWKAVKMSSHFVGVEIVGVSDLSGLFGFL